MAGHRVGAKGYLGCWAALVVLTLASWALTLAELGRFGAAAGLAIACVKATLVVLIFMHVIEANAVDRLVIFSALLFVVILVVLVWLDVATRSEAVLW